MLRLQLLLLAVVGQLVAVVEQLAVAVGGPLVFQLKLGRWGLRQPSRRVAGRRAVRWLRGDFEWMVS